MTELRDGFLYHPDGSSPTDQLKRLIEGVPNLDLDDLFAATKREAFDATQKAKSDYYKALEQLARLKARVAQLEDDIATAEKHEKTVAEAAQHFHETGKIDEVLVPTCHALLAAERQKFDAADAPKKANEIDAASKFVNKSLGKGWDISETHVDEEFVYVTVKRRRKETPPEPRPTRDTVVERVKQAFEVYRSEFAGRVQPLRLASVTVGNPRAP